MHEVYEKTSLTPKRVASFGGYIDWITQPSVFKHYPDFLFSYTFGEKEQLQMLELSRCITSSEIIGAKPYNKLNTPSAGNLHPIELYVQIRSVKGIISGIYHVDVGTNRFVLIQEIQEDGIETAVGVFHKFEGMIFVLSCVPYRSEWKYGERAVRYCYLDAGHQIAAIEAAAAINNQETTIMSDFDVAALNALMGFKGEEFTCAVIAIGEKTQKSVKSLSKSLIHVAPTDYSDSKGFVPNVIAEEDVLKSKVYPILATKEAVLQRRSARKFEDLPMAQDDFEHLMHMFSRSAYPLTCYCVVLRDDVKEAGVYVNGKMIKSGVFTEMLIGLLIDQHFIKNAQMVTVITAKHFSSDKLMLAGAFAHKLYLEAELRGLGFTGIGAFYDEKMQEFLQMKDYILYVCAVGK
ncbi:nitroreductase family protein [bacterium]|nr:nitroreductase family protein [bacterium]MBU1884170.1 nitroreductase family protein [bacterium]